ncbi:MAG TPA: hypothetical protein VNU01_10250 [Egibacteraceae bacterium]|nr:hypothetical protein [Egibacteraceae bacterium]
MAAFEQVGHFPSRPMAEVAATYLHANGIPATVWADDAGGTYPHVALYRGISLRVPAEDADAARALLAEADAAHALAPEPDAAERRPLRPVAKWVIRLAAAVVVAGAAISALPPR